MVFMVSLTSAVNLFGVPCVRPPDLIPLSYFLKTKPVYSQKIISLPLQIKKSFCTSPSGGIGRRVGLKNQ
jgi:hypothetical protein